MEVGRDDLRRMLGSLERIAVANEKLIELAQEERIEDQEIAKSKQPTYCPHCATLNPRVRSEGGVGLLDDYVLIAYCEKCGNRFFAIPSTMTIAKTPEEARTFVEAGNGAT